MTIAIKIENLSKKYRLGHPLNENPLPRMVPSKPSDALPVSESRYQLPPEDDRPGEKIIIDYHLFDSLIFFIYLQRVW